jgi:uncharacterized protein YkwD
MIRRLLFLLLAASLLGAAPQAAPPARKSGTALRPVTASRDQLILRINEERTRAGAPPLAPSAALEKAAQARAETIAARGALPTEKDMIQLFNQLQRQIAKEGYLAQGWTESITISAGSAADVIAYWKQDATYKDAMRHDIQDVGVGVSSFAGIPLYTFLFAWPKSELYARQTAPLKDLQTVREAMLAAINDQRKAAGQPPLTLDARLNEAAQKHAEDMLARTYYSHEGLEGSQPRGRVRAAGYEPDIIGENIAAGHTDVAEVMDAWLHSPGHRRNILEGRFKNLGIGVAVGSYEHRYQILWVQDFATLR